MSIIYDHTGGVEERLLTITSGDTWPQDAAYGELWIGNNSYRILKRISSIQATLEPDFAIKGDFTGDVTWKRRSYTFGREIQRVDYAYNITINRQLTSTPTSEFNASSYNPFVSGYTRHFSWQNHGNQFGASEFILYPSPITEEVIEVSAAVLPHTPTVHAQDGDDLTGSSGGVTVTSAGGAFTSKYLGCVLRVSRNSEPPTFYTSDNWEFEAFVVSVDSATQLTLSEPLPANYSGRGYVLSSPVDIEVSVMLEALEDEAYYQYTKNHNHQSLLSAAEIARKSLIDAMVRDNKVGEDSYNAGPSWYDPLKFSGVVQVDSTSSTTGDETSFEASVPDNAVGADGDQVFINSGELTGAIYERRSGVWSFVGMYTLSIRTTLPSGSLPTGFQFRLTGQLTASDNGIWQWNGSTFEQLTSE